jgi:transposase
VVAVVRYRHPVGVEGTGSYGAGLASALRVTGIDIVEVDRLNRMADAARASPFPSDL